MDFFDNVVNKSNAIIKERLNNPFGSASSSSSSKQASSGSIQHHQQQQQQQQQQQSSHHQLVQGVEVDENTVLVAATDAVEEVVSQAIPPTQASHNSATGAAGGDGDKRDSQFANIAADAEAVAQKAAKGAQKFGTFLFSMANKAGHSVSQTAKQAGQTVSQTAKQVKQAVESTSILNDLNREQQEFVRQHGGSLQAGELPWQSEPDEARAAYIREQILLLSQDKRNFVRAPPNDSDFRFDPRTSYPVALSLLKEDPNLNKVRCELVPKLVNEDVFWCNYFYRVSMLKQMSEKGSDAKKGWASSRSSSGEGPDEVCSIDTSQLSARGEQPFSPSYDASSTTSSPGRVPPANTQQQQQQTQDSFSLVETDNAAGCQESNLTSSRGETTQEQQQQDQPQYQPQDQQYQSNELESSESRKLVAEADDLKSKLRELNIGSLDFGQDASSDHSDEEEEEEETEEFQGSLHEFELVSSDVSAFDEEASNDEFRLQFQDQDEASTREVNQLGEGEEEEEEEEE